MAGLRFAPSTELVLPRSEEHTSELQSQSNLVCRLLLEKKTKHQFPVHDQYSEARIYPNSLTKRSLSNNSACPFRRLSRLTSFIGRSVRTDECWLSPASY